MTTIQKFIVGGGLGVFAVVALFLAARAGHGSVYQGGIVLFLYLVALIFAMITTSGSGAKNPTAESSHFPGSTLSFRGFWLTKI
jgi:hypothetical protein